MNDKPTQSAGKTRESGLERHRTHVPRLDLILSGGFIRGGMYVVKGPPGSGKTILGNQMAFQHARNGGQVVYCTLLSESHARMVANMRSMSFMTPEVVGASLQYLSGYRTLESQGLKGLLQLIQDAVRAQKATLLLVDGLDAAEDFAESAQAFKRFIHELQTFTEVLSCTTLLLSPTLSTYQHSEHTTVDGIVELDLWLSGPRAVRELLVSKFRGSAALLGRHEVEITQDGIVVHPRTEVQFNRPDESPEEARIPMPWGLPALDAALGGGLLSESTTALMGPPGSGKTLLGLKFLEEGARAGQPGVLLGFFETPERLLAKAERVGIALRPHVAAGLLEIRWQPPLENQLDSLAERLLERLRTRPQGRSRLFVDGLSGLRSAAVYPDRMARFLSALTHQLRMLQVTTLFSDSTPVQGGPPREHVHEVEDWVENVMELGREEEASDGWVRARKVRESGFDGRSLRLHIDSKAGVRVTQASSAKGSDELGGPVR